MSNELSIIDDRGRVFFGVLNCPLGRDVDVFFKDFSFFHEAFSLLGCSYAFILHDEDNNDDGSLKTKHIHFVLEFPNRRRCSSCLKEVIQVLNVPDVCVSLRVSKSLSGCLNYMLHQGFEEKFQYSLESIESSNLTWVYENINMSDVAFTKYFLEVVTWSNGDYLSLVSQLGLKYAKKYKDIIYMVYRKKGWL